MVYKRKQDPVGARWHNSRKLDILAPAAQIARTRAWLAHNRTQPDRWPENGADLIDLAVRYLHNQLRADMQCRDLCCDAPIPGTPQRLPCPWTDHVPQAYDLRLQHQILGWVGLWDGERPRPDRWRRGYYPGPQFYEQKWRGELTPEENRVAKLWRRRVARDHRRRVLEAYERTGIPAETGGHMPQIPPGDYTGLRLTSSYFPEESYPAWRVAPRRRLLGTSSDEPLARFHTSMPPKEIMTLQRRVMHHCSDPLARFCAYLWAYVWNRHWVTVPIARKLLAFRRGGNEHWLTTPTPDHWNSTRDLVRLPDE